jgi:hypothetical protein
MISSSLHDSEPIINLKNLFYESNAGKPLKNEHIDLEDKSKRENLRLLGEIQKVLQRCTNLTDKQRLMYCESQRYFMKTYLREMSKE